MVSDNSDDPNRNLSDMPASHNGTHSANNLHTREPDAPESPLYRAMIAGMNAWEMWEDMGDVERLQVIFAHYAPAQWFNQDALTILAAFWSDPAERGRMKAMYKAIGGNPWDLATAVAARMPEEVDRRKSGAASVHGVLPITSERPRFQTITAQDLYAMDLPPQQWIVQDLLPAGATLFVGRGKDGKSLLAWNLCMAVATGGTALGRYRVQHGNVLYLALEDGERRAQQRLKDQMALANMDNPPEHLELVFWDAPRVRDGFEESLATWLDEHPHARLVVVDILEKIRPRRSRNGNVYADDYQAIAPLQRIAQERNIAVLIVHHSNKNRPDDFRDTANGSMGLIGACDTFWSLQRIAGEDTAVLKIIGRDVDSQDLALRFEAGFWTVIGDAETVIRNAAHQAILDALGAEERPLTPTMLATMLDVKVNTMKSHLRRLNEKGLVLNLGTGHYIPRLFRESKE